MRCAGGQPCCAGACPGRRGRVSVSSSRAVSPLGPQSYTRKSSSVGLCCYERCVPPASLQVQTVPARFQCVGLRRPKCRAWSPAMTAMTRARRSERSPGMGMLSCQAGSRGNTGHTLSCRSDWHRVAHPICSGLGQLGGRDACPAVRQRPRAVGSALAQRAAARKRAKARFKARRPLVGACPEPHLIPPLAPPRPPSPKSVSI